MNLKNSVPMKSKKMKVIIIMTDDNKGLWSVYEESGQCIEADFQSESIAYDWCYDMGYEVVDSFNL